MMADREYFCRACNRAMRLQVEAGVGVRPRCPGCGGALLPVPGAKRPDPPLPCSCKVSVPYERIQTHE